MLMITLNGTVCCNLKDLGPNLRTKDDVSKLLGISSNEFYILSNGKITNDIDPLRECPVHIVPRIFGGKGGFGSMLRAIGAQIEKTTNREACRDLSGRRLRDINEEKRLKNWITQQAEREKQAEDRKLKKLERLCQKPKHEFKDEEYDKERSALPEKVEDALEQGLKASCSSTSGKRKQTETNPKKKKAKLWLGSEDELSSSEESEKDEDSEASVRGSDNTPIISENNSIMNSEDEDERADKKNQMDEDYKNIDVTFAKNPLSIDADSDESNKGTDTTPQISEVNSVVNSDDEEDRSSKKADENTEQNVLNKEVVM